MEDYPKTLLEFEKHFTTEEACREYLYQIRWPNGFACPFCGHQKYWGSSIGQYRCSNCERRISITAGTIFQDSRIPLQVWFQAIWQLVSQKHGISGLGLQRVLGIKRYETVWTMLHKLRIAMIRPGRDRLAGTVEVDEIYIGGRHSGKRGRGAKGKTLVVIAVEDKGKRPGRIRLNKVKDASGQSLIQAVKECVEPKSEVCTDDWGGYNQLSSCDYKHTVIRKTADIGENLLPLANIVASLLKRWLQGTLQGSPRASYLEYYLDEFVFRFNRRTSRSRGLLFYRLINQAVSIAPIKGQNIRERHH